MGLGYCSKVVSTVYVVWKTIKCIVDSMMSEQTALIMPSYDSLRVQRSGQRTRCSCGSGKLVCLKLTVTKLALKRASFSLHRRLEKLVFFPRDSLHHHLIYIHIDSWN